VPQLLQAWYVYIGRLHDARFYVGISQQQPAALLSDHRSGDRSRFTRAVQIRSIAWIEPHPDLPSARRREKQIKRWTHAKKQALVDGNILLLKALSKSRRT
jgi:putative endonuclease